MLKLRTLRFSLLATTLAIIVNLALSAVTFAHDKRWRGRVHDKKVGKFINGHDARDGRWDGRGPRFRFRGRRDRDERFIFRNRRDHNEWRDRWRGDGGHRPVIQRRRRF
jgi:hypothetical protein